MGRPRKPTCGFEYDSCTRVYHFTGERLPLPAPGTYDASAWTPPTHRRYAVHMQGDGIWWLEQNGAQVASGDCLCPSRANARKVILNYRERMEAVRGTQDQN